MDAAKLTANIFGAAANRTNIHNKTAVRAINQSIYCDVYGLYN
jgi:hypothetical protein